MTAPKPPRVEPVRIRWFAVVSLVGHLVLLTTSAWTLSHMAGHQTPGIVAGVLFALAYVLSWRRWLAPGSRHRLSAAERFTYRVVAVPVCVVVAAFGPVWLVALVGGSFVLLGDALDERSHPAV
ncbi:hypothetical protein [uncultured Tessaracoccus sp.]|mgnify:FL=1|uniref:hypothetical protein n=1 Tax=uncultured Tessaracoccus sp. TaxID=905023 RepID=UPI0025DDA1FE|nr:hypothetical protein [uncultured Tessaracoccus sp.]